MQLAGRNDGDPGKAAEDEKVLVASHQNIRLGRHRGTQHNSVIDVATYVGRDARRNHEFRRLAEKSNEAIDRAGRECRLSSP